MLTPRIETIVAEKQGKILLAKVDIDENTDLALDYHVSFCTHINRYSTIVDLFLYKLTPKQLSLESIFLK